MTLFVRSCLMNDLRCLPWNGLCVSLPVDLRLAHAYERDCLRLPFGESALLSNKSASLMHFCLSDGTLNQSSLSSSRSMSLVLLLLVRSCPNIAFVKLIVLKVHSVDCSPQRKSAASSVANSARSCLASLVCSRFQLQVDTTSGPTCSWSKEHSPWSLVSLPTSS